MGFCVFFVVVFCCFLFVFCLFFVCFFVCFFVVVFFVFVFFLGGGGVCSCFGVFNYYLCVVVGVVLFCELRFQSELR